MSRSPRRSSRKVRVEQISGGLDMIKLGNREVISRAYCDRFNFKGPDQQKKVDRRRFAPEGG